MTAKRSNGKPIDKIKRLIEKHFFYIFTGLIVAMLLVAVILYVNLTAQDKDDSRTALIAKTEALYSDGQFRAVITELEGYLKDNESDSKAQSLIASAYWQEGDLEKALSHYKMLAELEPDNAEIFYLLDLTARQLGMAAEATTYLRQAVEINPESVLFKAQLARLYAGQDQYSEAISSWSEILEKYPSDEVDKAEVYAELGEVYIAMGDSSKASEAVKAGLAIDAENGRLVTLEEKLKEL